MGMGQSTGRNFWRYACSDDSDRSLEGQEHGVQRGSRQSRCDLLGLTKDSSGFKQHEEIIFCLRGDG